MKTLEQRLLEGQDLQKAIINLNKSYEKMNARLKKRLERMLKHEHTYFITFTIAPAYYDELNYNNYLRKIKKALGSALDWIVNSDFGSENERLHFHAVASFKEQLDYNTILEIYKYGSVNFKPIYAKNEKAIREYLIKTLNHATKQTASKIHYSRLKIRRE